jgi:hypothetical protein
MISQFKGDLHAEGLKCRSTSAGWSSGMTDRPSTPAEAASAPQREPLTPAAKRALAEAEARRRDAAANAPPATKEFQGPQGPEPTRYGDWENKGIASDF